MKDEFMWLIGDVIRSVGFLALKLFQHVLTAVYAAFLVSVGLIALFFFLSIAGVNPLMFGGCV